MKRLFVSAAVLPMILAAQASAETKISTATTTPVRTSTVAAGQPDSILIETAGSIAPTASGAAVTLDSTHAVTLQGAISFNGVSNATGVKLSNGASGAFTSSGAINVIEDFTPTDGDSDGDLDGPFAQGSGRFGIRLDPGAGFIGNIANAGTITIEGNDSAGILLAAPLIGSLTSSNTVSVAGDRSRGVAAVSVSGDVRITGSTAVLGEGSVAADLGDVGGGVVIQNALTATGYRGLERQTDAVRAKFDADDLKQGGSALRITGSVGRGVFLDRPPADSSTTDTDEDDDGIVDTAEATAVVSAYGGAPAIDLGSERATTFGVVGAGELGFGLVNKGQVIANGLMDGVAATAVRVGQAGGGSTTLQGGLNNLTGSITAQAYAAQATGVLINATGVAPIVRNTGVIRAVSAGGQHDARAIVDLSGTVSLVETTGTIEALVTSAAGSTVNGKAVAVDLSANGAGATVRQTKLAATDAPKIVGEVRFGAGADRLELLAGTLDGALRFGAGDDVFVLDGGAIANTRISDTDGRLSIDVRSGRLALANTDAVMVSALSLGASGVLAVSIDPTAGTVGRVNVAGAAILADGSKVDVTLTSIVRGAQSYRVLQAGTLQVGQTGVTLAGAPFLFQAGLRADQPAGALLVDIRPKTAAEIGLNLSQTQAFDAVFAALGKNAAIEDAVLAQSTKEGFLGLYDQMLPDHSGGALMSAAAIAAAVSSATAQPMSIREADYTGVWAQEIQFRIQKDRDVAAGYKSEGFGFAAGADMIGDRNAFGVAASFVSSDYHDRGASADERISMSLLGGSLYWRYNAGGLSAHARGGLGYAWFDGTRTMVGQGMDVRAEADWTGWTAEAHAGASYDVRAGLFFARPQIALDYLRLHEDGYTEEGGGAGFDLDVDGRTGDLLTGEALLALGVRIGEETYFEPTLTAGWRQRLAGDAGRTTARFTGGADFTLDPEALYRSGPVVRVGLRGGAPGVLYAVEGGGTWEGGYESYDVRATVRFQF